MKKPRAQKGLTLSREFLEVFNAMVAEQVAKAGSNKGESKVLVEAGIAALVALGKENLGTVLCATEGFCRDQNYATYHLRNLMLRILSESTIPLPSIHRVDMTSPEDVTEQAFAPNDLHTGRPKKDRGGQAG